MNALAYLRSAAQFPTLRAEDFGSRASIGLITNFTDDVLSKLIIALSLEAEIYPDMFVEPYKRYHFDLADEHSELYTRNDDITFIVLDATPFLSNEISFDKSHAASIAASIAQCAERSSGHFVVALLPESFFGPYGDLLADDPLHTAMADFNKSIRELAQQRANVSLLQMERLFHYFGEKSARDLRSLYAFDIPYTNDFSLVLARELVGYLRALKGKSKKCLVLDLDNLLWGGVVGELGTHGIALGPGYPGYAYQDFQRSLLSFYERGVILAIASRNNAADVDEVFEKNENMVLRREHFSAIRANWSQKSDNIVSLAQELNIGADSIVFLDDDPVNREEVRAALPEVVVPDLPVEPEGYIPALFELSHYFTQLAITYEDKRKGQMYREENARKEALRDSTGSAYLKNLDIQISIRENAPEQLARIAQLTQKTNQFNVTGVRHTESTLEDLIKNGASVFSADASDRFGAYGIIAALSIRRLSKSQAEIDTYVMSCRAFGRGIESCLFDYALAKLSQEGCETVTVTYRKTAKNEPALAFISSVQFEKTIENGQDSVYSLDISEYMRHKPAAVQDVLPYITIHG